MSEYKRQAELLASGILSKIGEKFDEVQLGDLPLTEAILAKYGQAFNEAVQEQIDRQGLTASGKIGELAVPKINKFGNEYEMLLGYDPQNPASIYYKYVNKGVKGVSKTPKKKKNIGDTPYKFEKKHPGEKMITNIESWIKLGKGAFSSETQKKGLSKAQRKYKKLSKVAAMPNLRTIATNMAYAIKRDGLKTTGFFDKAIKKVFDKGFFETMALALGKDVQIQIRQIGNKLEHNGYNNK